VIKHSSRRALGLTISPINMHYLLQTQRKASEAYLQLSQQQEVKTKQKRKEKSSSPRSQLAFCMRSTLVTFMFLNFSPLRLRYVVCYAFLLLSLLVAQRFSTNTCYLYVRLARASERATPSE
jgi:hypothetical protein